MNNNQNKIIETFRLREKDLDDYLKNSQNLLILEKQQEKEAKEAEKRLKLTKKKLKDLHNWFIGRKL